MPSFLNAAFVTLALSFTAGPLAVPSCSNLASEAGSAAGNAARTTTLPASVTPTASAPASAAVVVFLAPDAGSPLASPAPVAAPPATDTTEQTGQRVVLTPQPVRDTLNVALSGFLSYRLILMNDQGRTLARQNGNKPVAVFVMSAYPAGKYFLRVYGDSESYAESFEFRIVR